MGVPSARILSLPNGVDLAAYRPADPTERGLLRERLGLPRDRCLAVFVGRLHPVKDVDTVLAATARVPELALAVVGDGPERARLEGMAERLGIAARVTFTGQSAAVPDILRASDLFLLSSRGEGMSNALLEAMACGLPCLVSGSVGGARELLGDGRGMLLADGDAAAWAAAVGRVAEDGRLRSAMGTAAASFVAGSLSLEAAAERLVRAYRTIARAGGRAAVSIDDRPAVMYVVSRFPVVTETFIVNEWLALSGRFRMELAALRRSGEAPVHPESRQAMAARALARRTASARSGGARRDARPAPARVPVGARDDSARGDQVAAVASRARSWSVFLQTGSAGFLGGA